MSDVDALRARLSVARKNLSSAGEAMERANALHDTAREMGGGIPGFGHAGNQRAASMVRSASDRAQQAWVDARDRIEHWQDKVLRLEARIAEAERVKLTDGASITDAKWVNARGGWWRVAKVNAKSVTVHYPGASFTERIPISSVKEWK